MATDEVRGSVTEARENDEVVFRRWLELGRGDGYRKGYAAALEQAAQVAAWEWAVTTNGADDHRWVVSADLDPDALDTPAVVWCQWCGVHRVEVPDWTHRPQCPAIANLRALTATPESPSGSIPAQERATEAPHAPWCPHVNDAATELCACRTEERRVAPREAAEPFFCRRCDHSRGAHEHVNQPSGVIVVGVCRICPCAGWQR